MANVFYDYEENRRRKTDYSTRQQRILEARRKSGERLPYVPPDSSGGAPMASPAKPQSIAGIDAASAVATAKTVSASEKNGKNDKTVTAGMASMANTTVTANMAPDGNYGTGGQTEQTEQSEQAERRSPGARRLTLSKIDIATGVRLADSVYELTRISNGKTITERTDEHGQIRFTLGSGASYQLHEISAPDGYRLDPSVYTIEMGTKGTMRVNGSVTNRIVMPAIRLDGKQRKRLAVGFSDISNGAGIAGQGFAVSQNGTSVESVTDSRGIAEFDMDEGPFVVQSLGKAVGYQASPASVTGTGLEGSVSFRGVKSGCCAFVALDVQGKQPLAGCTYVLHGDRGFEKTAVTGSGGLVDFGQLAAGRYSLTETSVPAGYIPETDPSFVNVEADGEVSINAIPVGIYTALHEFVF